jgi:hypothetical protein
LRVRSAIRRSRRTASSSKENVTFGIWQYYHIAIPPEWSHDLAGAKRPAGGAVRQAIDLSRPLTIPELDDAALGERLADVPGWRVLIVVE